MRKLASVQVIHDVLPIEGADRIELVRVLGWQCVAKKGEFRKYDRCVYFEIDALLPERPEFEFLRASCYKTDLAGNSGFRIKTAKLRGCLSQGLVMPLSILPEGEYPTGSDVSQVLGVVKYVSENETTIQGNALGSFPSFIPKTDEPRVQSNPDVLEELRGKPYYITCKMDGTSATFYHYGGKFGVCSRNLSLARDPKSAYWVVAEKLHLEDILNNYAESGNNYAVQGELCGVGIQKNPIGLSDVRLYVFNVYDINKATYLNFYELVSFCSLNGLRLVPFVEAGNSFSISSVDELLELAKGQYPNGRDREGIVIRPQQEIRSYALKGSRLSFKVINNDYLLKEKK